MGIFKSNSPFLAPLTGLYTLKQLKLVEAKMALVKSFKTLFKEMGQNKIEKYFNGEYTKKLVLPII